MEELHLKLKIEDKEALLDLKELEKHLKKLKDGIEKPVKAKFMKAFRDNTALASQETTRLGRQLDSLNKEFGEGSAEVQKFVNAQLKNVRISQAQSQAIKSLKQAYKAGEISQARFRAEILKTSSTQQLFQNKMKMATPIRSMQSDLSGVSDLLTTINPKFGIMINQIGAVRKAVNKLNFGNQQSPGFFKTIDPSTLAKHRAQIASIPEVALPAASALSGMAASFGAIATGGAAAFGVIGNFVIGAKAIKTGSHFEELEFQMTALINSTTKFKDQATGEFVSFEKNLELSLGNAKQIINQFIKDAPKLAGTSLKELSETASVTLGRLGAEGITDPKEQAKLIESMTVAIKTVTKGQQNVGVQLAQESRALISGEFKATNTLINQLAVSAGGKERFKELFQEAKQAGRLGEFLQEQLEPYVRASNFASDSLSNIFEVAEDVVTNFSKVVSDSGLFESFKEIPRNFISSFVNMEQGADFGKIKAQFLDLGKSIGENLSKAMSAFAPVSKSIGELGFSFVRLTASMAPFVNLASQTLAPVLSIVIDTLTGLSNAFSRIFDALNVIITPLAELMAGFEGVAGTVEFTEAAFTTLIPVFLALPFGPVVAGLAAIGGAFLAAMPTAEEFKTGLVSSLEESIAKLEETKDSVESSTQGMGVSLSELVNGSGAEFEEGFGNMQSIVGESMQQSIDHISNGSESMKGILNALKNNVALNAEEMDTLWNSGMLSWLDKTTVVLKGLTSSFSKTFEFIKTGAARLWQKVLMGAGSAISKLAEKYGNSEDLKLGQSIIASAGKMGDLKSQFEKIRLDVLNAGAGFGMKPKEKKRGSNLFSSGLRAGSKEEEETSEKAAKAAKKEAERLETAKKKTAESEKSLELAKESLRLTEERLKKESDLAAQSEALKRLERVHQSEKDVIHHKKAQIQSAQKLGQITEEQANQAMKDLEYQEIEQDYQLELLKIQEKKNNLLAEENNLKSIQAQFSTEKGDISTKISELESARATASGAEVESLTQEIRSLEEKLARLEEKQLEKVAKTRQKISSLGSEIKSDQGIAVREKTQSEELLGSKYLETTQQAADQQQRSLLDGAREIFNSITGAFDDGKITVEEAFQVAQDIFSKVGDLFRGGSQQGGGFAGIASSFGNSFPFGSGGGSSNFDPSTLTRGTDGVFTAFNKLTGVTESLGTSCGIAAKEAVGFGGQLGGLGGVVQGLFKGISGIFKGAVGGIGKLFGGGGQSGGGGFLSGLGGIGKLFGGGGAGGMFGGLGGAGGGFTAALSLGSTVFSAIKGFKKNKKKEREMKKIKELQAYHARVMFQFEQMEQAFEKRLEEFNQRIKDLDREIRKIDVGTSLFLGEKVIKKTRKQIEETIKQIGEGVELIIGPGDNNNILGAWGTSLKGIGEKATGLYAERNKQIRHLQAALDNAWAQIAAGAKGKVGQQLVQNMQQYSAQIRKVNDQFNSQIKQMTEQRKDLEEQLQKAIDEQKQNFINWSRQLDRARFETQFGKGSGGMFDTMIETTDKIRELMMSGLDPRYVEFMVAKLKEDAGNKMRNQYRDFLEGSSDEYLNSIRDVQDELFSVISEGRVTGMIKRTSLDKQAEIQRKIDRLREESVQTQNNVRLEDFGLALNDATDGLEALTKMLDQRVVKGATEIQAGQYREIDAIEIGQIWAPEILAGQIKPLFDNAVQTAVQQVTETPVLSTVVSV